jgi:membrane protein YqaA with SNARE-associated domain
MQKSLQILLGILSLLIVVVCFLYRKKLNKFKKFGYLGIFTVSFISSIAIFSPAAPAVCAVAGSTYNIFLVGVVASLGSVIADVITFNIGAAGGVSLKKTESRWFAKVLQYVKKYGFLTVFLVGAIPNPFFDVVGLVAGMSHFNFYLFMLAAFLGKWIKYTIFAFAGKKLIPIK